MERRQAEAFRDLERGQFMALGPALSRRPLGLRIGPTDTTPRNATPRLMPLPETTLDARAIILAAPPPEPNRPQRRSSPDLLGQLMAAKTAALEIRPEATEQPLSADVRLVALVGYAYQPTNFDDESGWVYDWYGRVRMRAMPGETVPGGADQTFIDQAGFARTQLTWRLAEGHELRAVSVLTQTADDTTSLATGLSENEGRLQRRMDYRFVERQLFFNQLLGEHEGLGPFDDLRARPRGGRKGAFRR
jgi:hypothetical protein